MSGYNSYSKSNNALDAEGEGRFPMTEAKRRVAAATGITQKTAAEVLRVLHDGEWHHSSKYYNCVDYYDARRAIAVVEVAHAAEHDPARVAHWERKAEFIEGLDHEGEAPLGRYFETRDQDYDIARRRALRLSGDYVIVEFQGEFEVVEKSHERKENLK